MYKKNRRKGKKAWKIILLMVVLIVALGALVTGIKIFQKQNQLQQLEQAKIPKWIDSQIINADGVSRNGKALSSIQDIVIHYVGNPGSTAQQNRDFYSSTQSSVSSHFIVGLEGEIIQCIPLNEMSAASNWRNNDTISVEVCHPDDTGKFNEKTYQALVKLTAWLCRLCDLDQEHVIRHYDITGKECPRYYVQHPQQWQQFKEDVSQYERTVLP